MNKKNFEIYFSEERLRKYLALYNNNEKEALLLYKTNIKLSEAFYPLLSILEIALRNSINKTLNAFFKIDNWFDIIPNHSILTELAKELDDARNKIRSRKEIFNIGKITAELTFGFWTKLFNSKYELLLWKPLRLAFPYMPKLQRKRNIVSIPLNNIRNIRNRIYHYEPIIWNISYIENVINECYLVLNWISPELSEFAKEFD